MRRLLALVAVAALGLLPGAARAATFTFNPAFGGPAAGRTFVVQVAISANDQAVNAVSGSISFPTDKLQVVSLGKAGTVVDTWVRDPSFSNAAGTVSFEGAIFNPGYQGPSGKVIDITFRAVAAGEAPVAFRQAAILANDGLGTSVLAGLTGARYVLTQAPAPAPVPAPAPGTGTPAPVPTPVMGQIMSDTHPTEDAWRNLDHARFSWQLPEGATGVQYGMDRAPKGQPGAVTAAAVSEVTVPLDSSSEDGAYYFHLRFLFGAKQGPVLTRRILVDRVPPEALEVSQVEPADPTTPGRELRVVATDEGSGLDRVEVRWAAGSVTMSPAAAKRFLMPALPPGTTDVLIRAVDRAGNAREAHAYVNVMPIPKPTLEVSQATGAAFGQGRTGDDIVVEFKDETGSMERKIARVGDNGAWRVSYPDMRQGQWRVTAFARDERGAQSEIVGPVVVGESVMMTWLLRLAPWVLVLILTFLLIGLRRKRIRDSEEIDVPIRMGGTGTDAV